jgi:hypothetical protein
VSSLLVVTSSSKSALAVGLGGFLVEDAPENNPAGGIRHVVLCDVFVGAVSSAGSNV